MEANAIQPRREAGKSLRRRRIVQAATDLAREMEFDAASMEQIAARARVSTATLYNLFENKAAIFQEILKQDFEGYAKKVLSADTEGEIERIFLAVELGTAFTRRNVKFYRTLARLLNVQPTGKGSSGPRRAFWQDRVVEAVNTGELRPETDANLLSELMVQIMRGLALDWAENILGADQWADKTAYGFALLLRNYVTKRSEARLMLRIETLERQLVSGCK